MANTLALYTEAPASFTITYLTLVSFSLFRKSTINISDSLDAVPFPTDMMSTSYVPIKLLSFFLASSCFSSVVGSVG